MGIRLQLVFIIASLLTFVYVILRIRKHGLNIEDSITWILWSILLLIVSFFSADLHFRIQCFGVHFTVQLYPGSVYFLSLYYGLHSEH